MNRMDEKNVTIGEETEKELSNGKSEDEEE